jgi:hypothetical protein
VRHAAGAGSVTKRLLSFPVLASLCVQVVPRGEVAPWIPCGHRDGQHKAWPAVCMRVCDLRATFLLRFHGRGKAPQRRERVAALTGYQPLHGLVRGRLCRQTYLPDEETSHDHR